jgi:CheY-like chemotaxis protein
LARLILHVDDDLDLPKGVTEALEADGYEWLRTADPETVMRVVEEQEPALVLMEIDLADCDGPDLLAGIRSARGDVPVLVLTRIPRDSGFHGEAIALGVADFLSKPVRTSELLASIREIALPPPPLAAPEAPARAASPGDLSGEIGDTPVPELLARLRRRGASGVLKLHRGEVRLGVQVENGTAVRLGAKRRAGASAPTTEEEAEAALFEAFGWAEGAWQFLAGRSFRRDGAVELSHDPAGLLMRGVLQGLPLERVRERLRARANLYVSAADPDRTLDGVELAAPQRALLEGLSGQHSLVDLVAKNAFEERTLYGLWVAGRIELHAVPTIDLTDLYGETPAPPIEPAAETVRVRERVRVVRERVRERAPARSRAEPPRPAPAGETREELSEALRELAQQVMTGDDFQALGVATDVSDEKLREAYQRQRARIPALDSSDLELRARAERIRDRIEAAYAHLEDLETRRAYALLRKEEDQDRQAKSAAERALEGERWFRKGQVHLEARRYDEAAEAFGMAAHLDPNVGEYLSHLGYALFLSKPGDDVLQREAMEHVANGIKRSPKREISYVYLGRMFKARGDDEAALKLFRRALRIKPDCHPALREIRLLEMRGRKGKGILSRILKS